MKFYYALALCLMTTFSLLAQTEVPLLSNPVLEQAHAKWQQENLAKWLGDDYTPTRFDVNCAEEIPTLNYLTAGEEIGFYVDTFDLDGAGGLITCLNCEDQNFGVAVLDSTALRYVSNGDVIAGIDTILVQFCTAGNETCYTFDYPILVKREGMSRTDPAVTLAPEESTLYTIDIEGLPGNFACANQYVCDDDYEGEPDMWVSQSKPYQFFYEASFYDGTDMVCFVICDNFTICDTVNIPFNIENNTLLTPPLIDDFSYEGPYPDKGMWLDADVYVNTDFSTNPVSVGMATFDGLDKNGKPYGGGFGTSDRLTSTYINLEGGGDMYLSFWAQQQGLGDRPEDDDSMQLHFKKDDGEWIDTILVLDGVASTVPLNETPGWQFYSVQLDDDFLHDDFQFRFVNLSSRTGALDIWNLDYIRLADNANNMIVNDIALVNPPSNILKNYTSMPWEHFEENQAAEVVDELKATLYNHTLDNQSINDSEVNIVGKNLRNDVEVELLSASLEELAINVPTAEYAFTDIAVNLSLVDPSFVGEDSLEFITTYSIDSLSAISRNDTVRRSTIFDNYFAHDDGTAESNIVAQNFANQSVEIAVQFTANVEDSLRAIQVHIPHIIGNINSQLLNFKVWVGGDMPGDTANYEMLFVRPEYLSDYRGDSLQGYTTYPWVNELGKAEAIYLPPGNFFIGWEQAVPCQGTSCVPMGYDKNTPEAARFNFRRRNNDDWEPFPVAVPDGAVMLRPVVGDFTPGPTDVDNIVKTEHPIKIFPNPASDRIQLQLLEGNYKDYQVSIFNNTGQLIRQLTMTEELDIADYQSGIYFLKIANLHAQTISNHKIVIIK